MRTKNTGRGRVSVCSGRNVRSFAMLLVVLVATAGGASAKQTRIGIHGGLSVPNIQGGTNDVSRGYTSRLGPFFGLFADYEVRPHLSLRGELNYSSQGGKRNGMQPIPADQQAQFTMFMSPDSIPGALYASFNNETIIDYLEIPILARLSWGRSTRFFIDAGPYVGFLVRAKTVTSGSSALYSDRSGTKFVNPYLPITTVPFDSETPIRGDINSTNVGVAGGIGLETPFGPGDVVFDARFSYGLTNIQKDTKTNGENNTGALAFTVGYSYPLHGSR